jgi:pimeloyl-ACP methyl ester carboxylesterase
MSADRTFDWSWRGVAIPVRYDLFGANDHARVLLLPALSTVSTRDEMAALARLLAPSRGVLVTDWPGFGDNPRPALDYEPDLYRTFLEALLAHLGDPPGTRAVVAAGHAAAYVIDLAARRPATFAKLVLVAPTWHGPLPTVMGGRPPILNRIRWLVQMPGLGELLYRVNVSRPVVRMMYKGHVYADPAFVTSDHLTRRMRLARRPGARFASACFVTGALDPFHDRGGFLAAARRLEIPVLVIYGEHTPRRSRAEMDALAALPNVESRVLRRGALGIHEELPDEIAPLIEAFLDCRP